MIQEIFGNQAHDPVPVAIKLGDLVHGTRITGVDPQTGALADGQQAQTDVALQNVKRAVEAAGASLDNVAQVSFFFKNFSGAVMRDVVNPLWEAMFTDPDGRPTYKFMPAPELPEGQEVHLEFWAVPGQKRNSIQIPGVAHTNPIPFGVKMGKYLFSSRCLPASPETGKNPEGVDEQLACSLGNASTLLDMAGMAWGDVTQGRAFVSDMANLGKIERAWKAKTSAPLAPVLYGVGGNAHVYVEFIAVEK